MQTPFSYFVFECLTVHHRVEGVIFFSSCKHAFSGWKYPIHVLRSFEVPFTVSTVEEVTLACDAHWVCFQNQITCFLDTFILQMKEKSWRINSGMTYRIFRLKQKHCWCLVTECRRLPTRHVLPLRGGVLGSVKHGIGVRPIARRVNVWWTGGCLGCRPWG